MPYPKIATCCYCGTRAALMLIGEVRHELACSACGAPLHDLKSLKARPSDPADPPRTERRRESAWAAQRPHHGKKGPAKKRKPRKSLARRMFSEAIDVIEDIFD